MSEIKEIYDDGYIIKSNGEIIGLKGKPLKGGISDTGYNVVFFKGKTRARHRIILEHFCPIEDDKKLVVNHKDGNKLNNSLDNLEWCNYSYNLKHAYKTGLKTWSRYRYDCEKYPSSYKLDWDKVKVIRSGRYSQRKLEKMYHVSRETIRKIQQYKCWLEE